MLCPEPDIEFSWSFSRKMIIKWWRLIFLFGLLKIHSVPLAKSSFKLTKSKPTLSALLGQEVKVPGRAVHLQLCCHPSSFRGLSFPWPWCCGCSVLSPPVSAPPYPGTQDPWKILHSRSGWAMERVTDLMIRHLKSFSVRGCVHKDVSWSYTFIFISSLQIFMKHLQALKSCNQHPGRRPCQTLRTASNAGSW